MPRWRLANNAKNTILLAAYLQQPIILVGHHGDLKDGVGLLDELADFINGLGKVDWLDMAAMAQINYRWRLEGGVLRVQPLGSRVKVKDSNRDECIGRGFQQSNKLEHLADFVSANAPAPPSAGGSRLRFQAKRIKIFCWKCPPNRQSQLDKISTRRAFRPFVRRLATEARDRLVAVVR